jgi:hypothetical protein
LSWIARAPASKQDYAGLRRNLQGFGVLRSYYELRIHLTLFWAASRSQPRLPCIPFAGKKLIDIARFCNRTNVDFGPICSTRPRRASTFWLLVGWPVEAGKSPYPWADAAGVARAAHQLLRHDPANAIWRFDRVLLSGSIEACLVAMPMGS